ncbi:MAG: hypothetical protein GXO91_05460 [FCB group bacterium]|nr:hypothetical protein [FCB group bacterium]
MLKQFVLCTALFAVAFSQTYDIGDTISLEDQNTVFDVCYGDYPSDQIRLADFNGALNGGHYYITVVDLSATW